MELIKENALLENLQSVFQLKSGEVKRVHRVEIEVEKKDVVPLLLYVKEKLGYKHLSHITCVDWLEDGKFELVYMPWSHQERILIMVRVSIERENPEMDNIDMIWRQANTYQREFREMYGIQFPGFVGDQDFILEDWDEIPPMRRDFDTEAYVKDHFFERAGREDAKDVREEIAKRSGVDIPDFAKKYSR
jgi:NADH-quinone oxidoreductase subunit C